ncbi:MAG: NfeD family protein, partial [Candidatus Thorarchaeota archaeon]
KVGAEIWEARSDNGEILAGVEVVIVSRESLKVHVKPWHGDTN